MARSLDKKHPTSHAPSQLHNYYANYPIKSDGSGYSNKQNLANLYSIVNKGEQRNNRGINKIQEKRQGERDKNVYYTNASPNRTRKGKFEGKTKNLPNPSIRNASSVKSYRGRKQTQEHETGYNHQDYDRIENNDHNISAYANVQHNNFNEIRQNVNNTISYYKESKQLPRSKSNSRKRGALILNERNNNKGFPSNAKIRKDFIYEQDDSKLSANKNYVKTIQARSTTAQSKRRGQPNHTAHDNISRPYSNFAPSGGTRSNITIDRSGSVGYDRVKSQLQNQSILSQINNKKSNSKKMIATVNEYEDDTIITANSNNYDKRSNLNTIIGIKANNDNDLSNIYIAKQNSKEISQNPRFNKIAKKDTLRSKSNKRVNKGNFEKVYMQSPLKLINRRPTNQAKLKNNLNTYESGSIINNSVSPHMPRVKEAIAREIGHKTALKKRSEQDLNVFKRQDFSSINNSKDNSK